MEVEYLPGLFVDRQTLFFVLFVLITFWLSGLIASILAPKIEKWLAKRKGERTK